MAFGSMVLDLLKVPNPHEQLVREAFGGGRTATPAGGASVAQAAPGQPAPAQPDSVQSPQEIADLMTAFMERQARSQQIDRGIAGIIGAFQQPEAARQTMAAFGFGQAGGGGGGGGGADGMDANSMFTQIQKVRQQQAEFENAQRARAASILAARNAGLDEATANYLHESGQLPKTLHELQTAGVSTVTDGNGQVIAIDQRGQVVNRIGAPKPQEFEALKQGDGTYLPYDPRAGQPAGPAFGTAAPPQQPNDVREYEYARSQGYPGDFAQFQQDQRRAGATQVNVGAGTDQQAFNFVKDSYDAANTASRGLVSLDEAERAVRGSAITGAGAEQKLWLQKAATAFGAGDTEAVTDTETFRAAIAPQVAATLRATVGSTQISDADRNFAEKAAGGSITLDKTSILRLIDIQRRANNAIIAQHNQRVDAAYPGGNPALARERTFFHIAAPEARPAPGDATTTAPAGGGRGEAAPQAAAPTGDAPRINSQAEYDRLPVGATYIAPNGRPMVKQPKPSQTGGAF